MIPDRTRELKRLYLDHLEDKPQLAPMATLRPNRHRPIPAALPDDLIITKARGAENGDKFDRLMRGDLSDYDGDHSRADHAFVMMLYFWTQDEDQIRRIHGNSSLSRAKSQDRLDYLDRSIQVAANSGMETYDWSRSRSHSLGSTGMRNENHSDLNRRIQAISFVGREKPGSREWIVDNIIWKGHAASWFGEGGIAKSLLAMHLALIVATPDKEEWFGFAVKTCPVLYLDFELDADEQHRRLIELCLGEGIEIPETFYYLNATGLGAEEAFASAAEECKRLGAGLLIVDSVGFALEGDSEAAKDVLGFYKRHIQPIKDAGASPLLIDHQAKIIKGEKYSDKQAFGSVYKSNAARSMFQIRGTWAENEMTATFTHKKNNFGFKEEDFSTKLTFEGVTESGRLTTKQRVRVERLDKAAPDPSREPSKTELVEQAWEENGRATAKQIAEITGLELKTVRNAASDLLAEGVLEDTGDKDGRDRILVPHSQPTKGTGTGMSEEDESGSLVEAAEPAGSAAIVDAAPRNGIAGEHGQVASSADRLRQRREERKQVLWCNAADRFYDMPEDEQQRLYAWVLENVAPRRVTQPRNSYWLKHVAEKGIGSYVSNGELKGAMRKAGFEPVWDNGINAGFRCGPRKATQKWSRIYAA